MSIYEETLFKIIKIFHYKLIIFNLYFTCYLFSYRLQDNNEKLKRQVKLLSKQLNQLNDQLYSTENQLSKQEKGTYIFAKFIVLNVVLKHSFWN